MTPDWKVPLLNCIDIILTWGLKGHEATRAVFFGSTVGETYREGRSQVEEFNQSISFMFNLLRK